MRFCSDLATLCCMSTDPPRPRGWHGHVVQVNTDDGLEVHVRHRDDPTQCLHFSPTCWRAFIVAVKHGDYDVRHDPAQAA